MSLKEGGYSGDGRNSFIVDYSTSENVLGRVGQDEFRRVRALKEICPTVSLPPVYPSPESVPGALPDTWFTQPSFY